MIPNTPALDTPDLNTLPLGATVLVLGGKDTGKTTWILEAAQALTAQGKTVGLLDCDVGQSELAFA